MPTGRPPAHAPSTTTARASAIWVRTFHYRTTPEQLSRHLSYSSVRPTVSRSWRVAAETAAPLVAEPQATAPDADDRRRLYRWGGRFSVALVAMRARFGGDLDQYLIYLIFMLAEQAHRRAARSPAPADPAGEKPRERPAGPQGLNALSVAEITRIPRETVRRKLRAMVDQGHILRGEDGLYYPGPSTDLDRFFDELNALF